MSLRRRARTECRAVVSALAVILCAVTLFPGMSRGQPTPGVGWGQINRSIRIGNLWDTFTNRNYGGVNDALQWPGGWWDNAIPYPAVGERRTYANYKGFVIGAVNVPDPQFPDVVWPYMVGQRDGWPDGEQGNAILTTPPVVVTPNTQTQILFKGRLARRTFRQANASVTVDGIANARLAHILPGDPSIKVTPELAGDADDTPYQADVIDPTIPADVMLETYSWTRMGVSNNRMVYAFADRRNDDYMFWHWRLVNDGVWGRLGVDRVDCCGGTHGTVQGVMMSLMFQWDRSSKGAYLTRGHSEYYNDSIWRYYGADYDGARTEDMRLVYVVDGDQDISRFTATYPNGSQNDVGDPDPVTGELLAAKTGGWQILHYDVSGADKNDDPAQPLTLGWVQYWNLIRTGVQGHEMKYAQMRWGVNTNLGEYYAGDHATSPGRGTNPYGSWIKASNDPATSGAYWPGMILGVDPSVTDVEQQSGLGPDDMAPGDTINGIHALAVKGLDIPFAQHLGRLWLTGQISDEVKDSFVHSTIDSLFMVMRQAKAVYEVGDFGGREASSRFELEQALRSALMQGTLALSPPAPETFSVNSGIGRGELSWTLNTSTGSIIAGWRVYRALGDFKGDSAWALVASLPPEAQSWVDTDVAPDFPYYYSLTTFDAQGTESTMFTRTDVPMIPAAPVMPELILPVVRGNAGDVIEYPVIATFAGAQSIELEFTVDTAYVATEPDLIARHAFGGSLVVPGWSVARDTIRIALASQDPVSLDADTLVTIRLRLKSDAPDESITVTAWTAFPATNIDELAATTTDGAITINRRALGDVDGDEAITALDASTILRYCVHLTRAVDLDIADVTGNGWISAFDAAWVLMKVVGYVDRFPVEDMASAKAAPSAPRTLAWRPDATGWTLSIDDATGLRAGEIAIALPDNTPAPVTGDGNVISSRTGTTLRVAFARPDDRGPVLFHFDRTDLAIAPRIESVSLNEGAIPIGRIIRPVVFSLAQNAPNPFNPATTIRFGMPEAGDARLVVHDVAGRRVRVLVTGTVEAGLHEVVWDGMDDFGRPCASGVYLYRLVAARGAIVRRMVLVR